MLLLKGEDVSMQVVLLPKEKGPFAFEQQVINTVRQQAGRAKVVLLVSCILQAVGSPYTLGAQQGKHTLFGWSPTRFILSIEELV